MTSPVIGTPWKKLEAPVSEEALEGVDKYWRASNYLSIGQIYLRSNPLMKEPFTREDVKHRLVGHWGTTPGLNFLIGHINRLIADHGQNTVIIMGPGHGGPAGTAQSYLDGTYTEYFPEITKDEAGLQKFFRQFSYPGGIPSHYAPETPGSIHEGGELGYALSHAYGAVMNNPSLFVPAIVGDGEAETGPLATGWQSNKLVNPRTDGIVLPILHLNGYKIANPTILARISDEELHEFFHGMGYEPYEFVAGFDDEDAMSIHRRFAELFETVFDEICDIKATAQTNDVDRPFYPMIIFRTPKGWTCPKFIDGKKTEGSWRSHQVPLASARDTEEHFQVLKNWLESYKPEELFTEDGAIRPEVTAFMPEGDLRIGENPNANGGRIREELDLPAIEDYEVTEVKEFGHGWGQLEATRKLGEYTRDIIKRNPDSFRIFGPDETASNRLQAAYEVTKKQWDNGYLSELVDENMAVTGQITEQLSEHQMEGFLEAYLLTGRHGIWSSYESFVHVIDSMLNQHAKWLEATVREIPWRKPISSMNLLVSSHVWRQDHNGFSHQDPGVIDILLNKNFNNDHVVGIYFPVDSNMLLAVSEKAYKSTNKINAIIAGKQPAATWLTLDEAKAELEKGAAEWKWASNAEGDDVQIVLASIGDVPTQELMATADKLKEYGVKYKFVNVVDLLAIQNASENDEALSDEEFTELFTADKPVLMAYHAYAREVRSLIWNRPNHDNFNIHGYEEQGSTTTPFDMVRVNNIDRYELTAEALRAVDADKFAAEIEKLEAFRTEAFQFAVDNGYDHPDYTDWVWSGVQTEKPGAVSATAATAGDNE
ncbi:phosphoketolase [Alloscardovia omnicolens]|uniref:Phosphoketolase n=2 Tax=Alloscardovia omnicolens TaxID=419015 RepID=A0A2I1M7K8_9BIFI|nr:phosphoketolase [Alloscardovia omnicolens]KWZ75215.1 D-xylulose 5-phosphate/D-fructose 6-phosphate phosphoketolase [Alloscardovia omnicolens]MDK6251623.1 phosphoketolase [Alloscardovia omnicolens]MDK6327247.1 phosphoketolase [Alloscardovia omnicolens]MDK6522561.1 phosphoketolase [Alloscardovia omnicolens]MDK8072924.1 phosphoketolase [Alloscardovia omnicolens]